MKRYIWLAFLLILAGATVAYREIVSEAGRKPQRRSGVSREVAVRLAPAKKGPIAYVLDTSGDVMPLMQVDVVSRVSGYIERIHFAMGDRISAGQVVAIVEPKELHHRVEEDEAAWRVARANLQEKETQMRHAEKQAERARTLRQREFISSQESDEAETRLDTAKAQKELAEAQLAQRSAALSQSRYQWSSLRNTGLCSTPS